MAHEHTSARVAAIAALGVRYPDALSYSAIQSVCASALTQTGNPPPTLGNVANALWGEQTSARIASIAARGIDHPASLTMEEIQAVCGSVLTQAPNKSETLASVLARAPGAHAYYNR
jgi:hypothetical protein